ncbi:DUF4062 domain-containing protein [Ruminococcus sp. AF21-3]|nr:DUF4062 domain-containing protein [Ruminococcus sp. AF21-3]
MDDKKFQIFISSTYEDLIEERRAVQDAILSMYHFPVGMELFGATSDDQWKVIQDTIDSSDYYVLIIAHRYGSLITAGEYAGISYTEREFLYAKESGVPILAFIRTEDSGLPKYVDKDTEIVAKLNRFKHDAMTDRTVTWWANKDELASKVTASLYKEFNKTKRPGWIRTDKFDIEASYAEILQLNKQVRQLQEENKTLKEQVEIRKPELNIGFYFAEKPEPEPINPTDNPIEDEIFSHEKLLLKNDGSGMQIRLAYTNAENLRTQFEPISRSDLVGEPQISRLISDEKIKKYNSELPSKEEIDAYIVECEKYRRIVRGGVPFDVQIKNDGKDIANNVKLTFEFPDELSLYETDDILTMREPQMPKMPKNIIREAEKEWERRLDPQAQVIHQMALSMSNFVSPSIPEVANLSASLSDWNIPQTRTINIRKHDVEIRCERIQHKDYSVLEGLYVVPEQKGRFQIKYEIMCDEFTEPVEGLIYVEVV